MTTKPSRSRRRVDLRRRLNPAYDKLETRATPAVYTWSGGGPNSNWSTASNWSGGAAPANGGTVVFPSSAARHASNNNIRGLSLAEIQLAGGYSVTGNAVTLTGAAGVGIASVSGNNAISNAINLGAGLTFTTDTGALTLSGVISGTGSLTSNGAGKLVLKAAETYTGSTVVTAGTLADGRANALRPAGTLVVEGTGVFDPAGFSQTLTSISDGGASSGSITDSGGAATLTVNNAVADVFSGTIGGKISLVKGAAGTLTLSGGNTYSGGTTIHAGALQIGAGGATGSLGAGPVVDNAVLGFDLSSSLVVANAISGSGAIKQIGAGTTILTAANSNTGTSTITAGTLQFGNGGTTGAPGSGPIADNANLAFDRSNALTIAKVISGAGSVSFSGAGTTTLTAANTYSGPTIISAGVLRIGAGGTVGTLGSGSVVDDATLTFDRSNALTVVNAISGAGSLTQIGTGTTTLSAANTYSGATLVSAGVLKAGRAGAVPQVSALTVSGTGTFDLAGFAQTVGGLSDGGVATGKVTDSGASTTLTINQTGISGFSGVISGPVALTLSGPGTLTLGGADTYTGTSTINAGTLVVTGKLSASAVTVNGSGTLRGGGGTVGAISDSGGTIDPGPSATAVGLLNSKNASFTSTSAFDASLHGTTPGTGFSQLNLSGSLTLGASTALSVSVLAGFTPTVGSTYAIIKSASPISGTFASLPEGSQVASGAYRFLISYKNDVVTLTTIASTSTVVSSSLDPSTYGQLVTLKATVTDTSGAGAPTGAVQFYDGGTLLGAGSPLSGAGSAATSTFTLSTFSAGSHSITAVYTATGNFGSGTSPAFTQTVNAAPLTITANNQTKVYGAALPTLTASYSGLVNGDTPASLATLPTLTTTATPASHVAGNPYAISASGAVDSDYAITYVSGSLSVTPALLTITADNQSKVYGAALPSLTASYSGFVNGDTPASLATAPTLTTTATASSHVAGNPYTISASGAVDSDYAITYVSGSLTVTPGPLTITADNQTKVYGAALPTLTASYSGLVNGDTPASLTTPPTLTTTATASSHVAGNPYAISASGAVDSDYAITYVSGSLSVTPALLTLTADNQTKVYGAALPSLTASYSGLVNGDTPASLTTLPTLSTTATASSHVAGNPYAITASGAVDSDYAITYVSGSLSVTPALLTITADNQSKVYGAALPTLTASYSGFVNGDTPASLTTLPTLTTTATSASHVAGNPYTISASGAVDSDYAITYVSGSLTVTPGPLTITADNQTKVYGAALPTLTASYSGFVNGDTPASLTTLPTLSTTATASSHVAGSPYAISASGAVDPDYAITYVFGSLTVTPALLTITAGNQSKVYGAALPSLTASYSGLVIGDTPASLTTLPTLSTTATASSHVAGSPYAISASGAVDPDYAITYVSGSLSVTPALLTLTADNQTKVYGAALPTLTASYSGLVNGDTPASLTTLPTLSTTATSASHVAGNPFAISASGAVDPDYAITYVSGSLTVTPAPLTITTNGITTVFGQAIPLPKVTYAGLVEGATAASIPELPKPVLEVQMGLLPGAYPINLEGTGTSDYTITEHIGVLTVLPPTGRSERQQLDFLTTLYVDLLGRSPDARGVLSWYESMRKGASPRFVANRFLHSRERMGFARTHSDPPIKPDRAVADAFRAGGFSSGEFPGAKGPAKKPGPAWR